MRKCLECDARYCEATWICPSCGRGPSAINGFPSFAPELDAGDHDADYLYDALADAERTHFWFVTRAELLVWAIRRYSLKPESILEVGCGTGGVTRALRNGFPNARIVAADSRTQGLQHAVGQVNDVEWLQLDALRLPFDSEFDVAGA